ncbi:MAG: hypothetical protein M1831_005906 [Alyxoria varia]|nr:MAG: hypothetical protein M1831_005906 [Alyxoria varia]
MATHEVEQKILGRLARDVETTDPILESALEQILGISVLLSRRLLNARKLRRQGPVEHARFETLKHHIIWMTREGLDILQRTILPRTVGLRHGKEMMVFSAKLKASFFHILCLFHNVPPITLYPPEQQSSEQAEEKNVQATSDTGQARPPTPPPKNSEQGNYPTPKDKSTATLARPGVTSARDPIFSIISDESNITNPWERPNVISPPPGFEGNTPPRAPKFAEILLPSRDFRRMTNAAFSEASALAAQHLSGSNPLRLCISLEYCAFLYDCLYDDGGCNRVARIAIRKTFTAEESMNDHDFDDASSIVGTLGRFMRRKRDEPTPKFGAASPDNPALTGNVRTPSPAVNLEEGSPGRPVQMSSLSAQLQESQQAPQPPHTQQIPPPPRMKSPPMSIPRRPVGTPPDVRSSSNRPSAIPRPAGFSKDPQSTRL